MDVLLKERDEKLKKREHDIERLFCDFVKQKKLLQSSKQKTESDQIYVSLNKKYLFTIILFW